MTARLLVGALVLFLIISVHGACSSANNRPLIYGMNPTPMDWWELDPNIWDSLLFQKMAQAGCTSARIGINWDQIEPVRGVRDWTQMDKWVKYCLDNNIEPVILINSTPEWALPDEIDPLVSYPTARYPPREEMSEVFSDWCYDLVRRYRGRARYYEFWNEANGYGWYTALQNPPTYSRADLYTPWMIRAYKAVKLADPTAQMSTTGIDDGGDGHAPYFIQQIYNYGGKGYFDAVADHPYPAGGDFQAWKLDNIRSTLDSYGDTHVKVWITEFGYSWPSFADQVNTYFSALVQDKYDYVRIATWHTANEFPWEAGFGLLDRNLNPKPEYNAFKNYPKPSRPTISNITTTSLSPSSVRISYNTNVAARGLVMYGTDDTYGNITARDLMPTTTHQVTLVGLQPDTTYHFRIRAGAVEDGDAFSQDRTFTTAAGPVVNITSGPTVSNITESGAEVTWTTDVPSTSAVNYSTDYSYSGLASAAGLTTNHTVELKGLQGGTNYQFRVVSTAAGYADAVKEGRAFTTPQPHRLLVNGGFEEVTSGWTFWEVYPWRPTYQYSGHMGIRTDDNGALPPTPHCMEGSRRVSLEVGWASAVGGLYQTIEVNDGTYLVSGWVGAGCDGGTESVQLIGIDGEYTGGIPEGSNIADLTASSPWKFYARDIDVTTGKLTVALRVSQWSAVDVIAGHFDGISVIAVQRGTVGRIKSLAPETKVVTDGSQVVSAVFGSNVIYIQEPDRSSGIRVNLTGATNVAEAQQVRVAGTLRVIDGETVIDEATLISGN